MEDHVGRLLTGLASLLALAAALGAVGSLVAALAPASGSEEWAAVGLGLGLLAALLGRPAPEPRGAGRALALASGLLGALVALALLGQAALLVGRAFLAGGPSLGL